MAAPMRSCFICVKKQSLSHRLPCLIQPPVRCFGFKSTSTLFSRQQTCQRFTSVRKSSHASESWIVNNPLVRYVRSLKWVPIPLGLGFAYIAYQQFGHIREREEGRIRKARDPQELLAKDWQVAIYRNLPLNIISRLWGKINSVDLPVWMRTPMYKFYIWAFDCKLDEAAVGDLKFYKNLGHFFCRSLKRGVRPVDKTSDLTCPSDGKVLYLGKSTDGYLEQIKGITYPISEFLGPVTWTELQERVHKDPESTHEHQPAGSSQKSVDAGQYENNLKSGADTDLYHCVIYLAPGDYHGFHSSTDWTVSYRRHFPGDLLSVNPVVAGWVRGLFNYNERVVYVGEWLHGFFSMTAVGATNVGSVRVYVDKDLVTNCGCNHEKNAYYDAAFMTNEEKGIPFSRGEPFGEFNLGSTIVLVFEAPKNFKFAIQPGQQVKYGQALGGIEKPNEIEREKQG